MLFSYWAIFMAYTGSSVGLAIQCSALLLFVATENESVWNKKHTTTIVDTIFPNKGKKTFKNFPSRQFYRRCTHTHIFAVANPSLSILISMDNFVSSMGSCVTSVVLLAMFMKAASLDDSSFQGRDNWRGNIVVLLFEQQISLHA